MADPSSTSAPGALERSGHFFQVRPEGPVACVWHRDFRQALRRPEYVAAADGHAEIVLASRRGRLSVHVLGPTLVTRRKETRGLDYTTCLWLRPGAIVALFGLPASDLRDRAARLDEVCPRAASILQRLAAATHPLEQSQRLIDIVERELAASRTRFTAVERAVRAATHVAHGQPPSMRELARHLGTTERTLRRLFAAQVGIPPASLPALQRFRSALERVAHTDAEGSAIAAEVGYADQSHMIRDFRARIGSTPSNLRRDWVERPLIRPALR